jgi:hypothetical protein
MPAKQRQQTGANVLKIDPAIDFAGDFVQAARACRDRQMMECLFHVGLGARNGRCATSGVYRLPARRFVPMR